MIQHPSLRVHVQYLPTVLHVGSAHEKFHISTRPYIISFFFLFISVPSQAPSGLTLTASSSTSITASWQLPPEIARHGRIITGFKLFYQKKGSSGSMNMSTINNGATLFEDVSGLEKFTEYKFQVLAFTSDGDGPKSSVKVERTKEDGKR